jgi:hypothetical protein
MRERIRPAGSRDAPRLMPSDLQFVAIGMPVGAHRGNPVPWIDPCLQNRAEKRPPGAVLRIDEINPQETP